MDLTTPHDLAAERATLGAVLVDPSRLSDIAAVGVTPGDFFRVGHRRIMAAMLDLAANGQIIDLVTVTARLRERGNLDEAGGPAYVAGLADGVPRSANVAAYASIVLSRSRDRVIERALTEAVATVRTRGSSEAVDGLLPHLDRPRTRDQYATRLADEIDRERARREARKHLENEARGPAPTLDIATLRDRLARPRAEAQYLIEGWQPAGSRVMLVAAAKSGKTTAVGCLVRSLVDGDPWLGRYSVAPIDGVVGIIDTEMSGRQLDDWLSAQRIVRNDRVLVVSLRGAVSSLDLLDPATRAQWAEALRSAGVRYLVLDCLRPVMDALGLDEHRDAGRLLVAIDALLTEACIPDACLVHHMGHAGERARGDSRLVDWPDVTWRLVRPEDDPAGARYITAYGRDVDVPESQLAFDSTTRHLTLVGGSRREAATADAQAVVMDLLQSSTSPMSARAILAALSESGIPRDTVRDAISAAVGSGLVVTELGPRRAILHRIAAQCAGVRDE